MQSNLMVYEIADLIEYVNARQFSDMFKKRYGMLPNEYKQSRKITLKSHASLKAGKGGMGYAGIADVRGPAHYGWKLGRTYIVRNDIGEQQDDVQGNSFVQPISITIVYAKEDLLHKQGISSVISAFEKSHPNIVIDEIDESWTGSYGEYLKMKEVVGTSPGYWWSCTTPSCLPMPVCSMKCRTI